MTSCEAILNRYPVGINFMCQPDWAFRWSYIWLKHYFWVYPWACFQKRWIFELVDWVKQLTLPNVDWHCPMHWEPEENKNEGKGWIYFMPDYFSWDIVLLLSLVFLVLKLSNLDQNLYHWFSGSQTFKLLHSLSRVSSLQIVDHGTSQPPNQWANSL